MRIRSLLTGVVDPVRWGMAAIALCGLLTVPAIYRGLGTRLSQANGAGQSASDERAESSDSLPALSAVSALGRLEPEGEITVLSAPSSLDGTTTRVGTLLVGEGDWVKADQVVAVLDVQARRQAAVEQATAAVQIAEAELARVKAGARSGEIDAQKALVVRLEAELANALQEYQRFEMLAQRGAISDSERDSRRLVVETTQAELENARSSLNGIAEVRPVDVSVAEAEVERAIATVSQAKAELEATYIRSPKSGQVININALPGEIIGNEGILELGQTTQMVAIAEIYETDIGQIKVGQKAIITSAATQGKLQGTVSQIGLEVSQQDAFSLDPTTTTDNRIVEVRIRLDAESSEQVSGLSNLQVNVVIQV